MDKIKTVLTRGTEEVIVEKNLKKRLRSGKKLRVKLGIDPTAPDLHLGHAVVLRKLRQFQDAGHKAVLIIGDFTALIGDPSGRDKTRPPLSKGDIKKNEKKYLAQASKIIDIKKAEIRHNSEWLDTDLKNFLEVLKSTTTQQVLHRADFQKRIKEEIEITLLEQVYPVLQGYDSVAMKADVELGGTDQKFNLLMGRHVQKYFEMEEQDILTVPLIEGTDGKKKMSKSYGNYISLDEPAKEIFGKTMSVPDGLIDKYFETLTDTKRPTKDPYKAKLALASEITAWLHSPKESEEAKENFLRVFSKNKLPEEMPELKAPKNISPVELLVKAGVKSKSEARRLIEQGGARVNDEKIKKVSGKLALKKGDILRVGKRKFFKIS